MAVVVALASSIVFGVADFLGGIASRRVPSRLVVLFSQLAGLVAIAIAAPFMGATEVTGQDLLWAAAAGILGMAGLLFFYEGLAAGRMSVVSPLAGLISIAVPSLFGIAIGERPGTVALVGVVVAVPAVVLVGSAADDSQSTLWRGGVVHGLVGGLGFGGFFILLSRTADASGMWALVAMRSMTVGLLAVILVRRRTFGVPARSSWLIIGIAGVADVLANLLFLVAARGTLLVLASVLVALYPVTTLLLAKYVLGDRTNMPQRFGLALAALAVIAMTVG
jgi:drug/metabolite transporter (DMT)-like permease